MRVLLFLLFALFLSSCIGGSDVIEFCDSEEPVNPLTLSAIPYMEGEILSFSASDSSNFDATVVFQSTPSTEVEGCREERTISFSGGNTTNTLAVTIELLGGAAFPNFDLEIDVNRTTNNNDLDVDIDSTGAITAVFNSSQRIISDTVLHNQNFQNVLVQDYRFKNVTDLERSYYNVNSGLIGVELIDGSAIWLNEN